MTKTSNYTGDMTPGYHGNQSHGITRAREQLRKGEPFDGLAGELYNGNLARWGYSETDLSRLGVLGSVIERTAKLNAVADLLWGGLLMAARCGDVESFYTLERNYGSRVNQALQSLYKLLDLQQAERDTLDYESILQDSRNTPETRQDAPGRAESD